MLHGNHAGRSRPGPGASSVHTIWPGQSVDHRAGVARGTRGRVPWRSFIVDRRGSFPAWSHDGHRLVDVTESTGRTRAALHVVDLRRGRVRVVSHDSSQRFGSDDFGASFSPNRKTIAFISASPTGVPTLGGSEIRFVHPDGRNEHRLTYHCAVVEDGLGTHMYGTWLDDLILGRNGVRDTIVCGRGHDEVSADRVDRVAADCESVKRR